MGIYGFPVPQLVKNLPAMQETCVQSLGWKDLPEKKMATHSSILAWRIPWTEEPGRLLSMGSQESDTMEREYCFKKQTYSTVFLLPLTWFFVELLVDAQNPSI